MWPRCRDWPWRNERSLRILPIPPRHSKGENRWRGRVALENVMSEDRPSLPRPRCRRLAGVRILASGSYVPDAVVTNDHLHQKLGFDSNWIVKRTGILER